MKVGSARYCISPRNKEFYLIGYKSPFRNNPVEEIHDDIYCQSLLLEVNKEKMFIASFDFLELEDAMVEEVKTILARKYGINRDLVLLTVTHNHSSVMSYHKHWHSGKFEQEYYNFIMEIIIKSFATCENRMQSVIIKYGSEIVEGFYSNRNHKGQLADNEIGIYHFINENNECIGAIVNWAVHSTVLNAKNNILTGDLAGQVSQKLGEYWGIHPLIIIGAAADSSNRHERIDEGFQELERVSNGLANRIATIEINKEIKIDKIHYQILTHTIVTNIEKYHEEINKQIEKNKNVLDDGLLRKLNEQLNLKVYELVIQFGVFHLGELQIITFPGELGSKFGIILKENCIINHCFGLIAGYTNGFHHYFMPKEEYWLSFETIGNPIPPGEPEKIIEKMKEASALLARYYEK